MHQLLKQQSGIGIFGAGAGVFVTCLMLINLKPTAARPYVEPKKPFNLSEDAVFRNGKSRLMKVFFDRAVVEPPGVILRRRGGIGNQLFQYACSYALARDKNWTLYTYVERNDFFKYREFLPGERQFALDQFNIHVDNLIDPSSDIRGKTKTVSDKELLDERMDILRGVNDSTFLEVGGYCQSKEFWKPYQQEVKEMFSLTPHPNWGDSDKVRITLSAMEKTESVAVHVRRGGSRSHRANLVPISYQRMAMEQMSEILGKRGKVPVFFVFSDDIQGATEGLKDLRSKYEILFISHNSLLEFYLMMKCKHIIIPNSTFSWWAAFLNGNKDKVVIASKFNPEFFTKRWKTEEDREFPRKFFGSLYYPKEWIVLDPFNNGSKPLW